MADVIDNAIEDSPNSLLPISDEAPLGRTASDSNADRRNLKYLEKQGLEQVDWFKTVIDPFHDEALQTEGYPDYDATNSIVQVVKKVQTIVAPPGLSATDTWEMNLFTTGMEYTAPASGYPISVSGCDYNLETGELSTDGQPIGMLTHFTGKTGLNGGILYPTQPTRDYWIEQTSNPTEIGFGALSPVTLIPEPSATTLWVPDKPFLNGPHRVIGYAFELVNTTAPLYVQGGLVCYKQNRSISTATGQGYSSTAPAAPIPTARPYKCDRYKGPPTTLEEAMLLPDSRLWHAKHGAYVVGTQMGRENPFLQNEAKLLFATAKDQDPGAADSFTTVGALSNDTMSYSEILLSGPGASTDRTYGNKVNMCWQQQGIWATGLSPQTRFQLNLRVIIERAPTLSEAELVVLARPSPCADEIAWRMYSECVRTMPPGVQLRENWTGKWFSDAISTVASAVKKAAPVARLVAPALGPEAVLALEIAEKTASLVGKKKKKKRKTLQVNSAKELRELARVSALEKKIRKDNRRKRA